MSYGAIPYGLGPYGGGGLTLDLAWASSTNTVRVETSVPMLQGLGFEDGSALRPDVWQVENLDTDQIYTVLGATAISPSSVDILLLEPMGSHHEAHRVTAIGLRSDGGIIVTSPTELDFLGVVAVFADAPDPTRVLRVRDLANPSLLDRPVGAQGTLVTTSGGDYATEEGEQLIRKLVLRRIVTDPEEVPYLRGYGAGLKLREPMPNRGSLSKLKVTIERQAELEPEVARAMASLTFEPSSGILEVDLRLTLRRDGATIDMRIRANPSAGNVFVS